MIRRDTMEAPVDEIDNVILSEACDLEWIYPQERQEGWEQEDLNELQVIPSLRPFETLQEQQLMDDQHEQTMQIYEMERWDKIQQHK